MANDPRTPSLADPVLVGPLSSARVPADGLTLRWEASEGATSYLVQVSADTAFSEPLLAEDETDGTSLDLDGHLEIGATYFWRVMACRGGAESPGERVESFIPVEDVEATDAAVLVDTPPVGAGNASDATRTDPDAAEDLGPVAELFKSGGASAAAEATGGAVGADTASEMGVEPEGVASAQILGIAVGVLTVIAILVVLLFNWKGIVRSEVTQSAAARVPGTSVNAIRYPVLYETEMEARRALDHYEVVNDAAGRYRIPIQQAMDASVRAGTAPRDSAGALRTSAASAAAESPIPDLTGR